MSLCLYLTYTMRLVSTWNAGPPSHMLDSYVDVTQPAPASVPSAKGGFSGLAHILELATSQSHIDHPICAKCLEQVKRELQDSIAAAEAQASAYESALKSLLVRFLLCVQVQRHPQLASCLS